MKFQPFLQSSAHDIDKAIDDFLVHWYKETERLTPRLSKHVQTFGKALEGGKRIRGTMVFLGYILTSKTYTPELLKIAVAYELFQTAILVHDDIIDNSSTRRGKQSLHEALGSGHFGTSQAICLADMGFFLSYKLIAESSFEDSLKSKATAYYSKRITETVLGEMLDIELSYKPTEANERGVLAIYRLKTAYYTFVAPLSLGAILAGAGDDEFEVLQTYGENIGIAFQIQDDIWDVFGTKKSLKKDPGGDIKEGKQTLLYIKAIQKANKSQAEILDRYYGSSDIGEKEIETVKHVFEETGARTYAEKLAMQHAEKARQVIPQITDEVHMQEMFGELIEYVQKLPLLSK